jgi:hypothetical protein
VSAAVASTVFRITHPRWLQSELALQASCICLQDEQVVLCNLVGLAAQRYAGQATLAPSSTDWEAAQAGNQSTSLGTAAAAHIKSWGMLKQAASYLRMLAPEQEVQLAQQILELTKNTAGGKVLKPPKKQKCKSETLAGKRFRTEAAAPTGRAKKAKADSAWGAPSSPR